MTRHSEEQERLFECQTSVLVSRERGTLHQSLLRWKLGRPAHVWPGQLGPALPGGHICPQKNSRLRGANVRVSDRAP
jgi:hypothetical protein